MEKLLAGTGLFMSSRNLRLMREKLELNITNRMKLLFKETGIIIGRLQSGRLEDDMQVADAGGGDVVILPGMAIFDDYEFVELTANSGNIAVPADSTTYYVLLVRLTDAITENWALKDDQEKEPEGTVAVATGSLVLTGTGTAFDDIFEVGDRVMLDASNAANQKEMVITVVTDATHITVSATAGDGSAVTLTTESGIDFWHIGKYADGYPTAGDKNLLEHDTPAIILCTSKAGYTHYIELGTVHYTGITMTVTDTRKNSLAKLWEQNIYNSFEKPTDAEALSITPDKYGAGTKWISSKKSTGGEQILDDTLDYRDRMVHIQGYVSEYDSGESVHLPGDASYSFDVGQFTIDSAGAIDATNSKNYFSGMVFFGSGGNTKAITIQNDTSETLKFYADSSNGDLVITQTSPYYVIIIKVDYSPKMNAY